MSVSTIALCICWLYVNMELIDRLNTHTQHSKKPMNIPHETSTLPTALDGYNIIRGLVLEDGTPFERSDFNATSYEIIWQNATPVELFRVSSNGIVRFRLRDGTPIEPNADGSVTLPKQWIDDVAQFAKDQLTLTPVQ
jgi:hypothetical protein